MALLTRALPSSLCRDDRIKFATLRGSGRDRWFHARTPSFSTANRSSLISAFSPRGVPIFCLFLFDSLLGFVRCQVTSVQASQLLPSVSCSPSTEMVSLLFSIPDTEILLPPRTRLEPLLDGVRFRPQTLFLLSYFRRDVSFSLPVNCQRDSFFRRCADVSGLLTFLFLSSRQRRPPERFMLSLGQPSREISPSSLFGCLWSLPFFLCRNRVFVFGGNRDFGRHKRLAFFFLSIMQSRGALQSG